MLGRDRARERKTNEDRNNAKEENDKARAAETTGRLPQQERKSPHQARPAQLRTTHAPRHGPRGWAARVARGHPARRCSRIRSRRNTGRRARALPAAPGMQARSRLRTPGADAGVVRARLPGPDVSTLTRCCLPAGDVQLLAVVFERNAILRWGEKTAVGEGSAGKQD